MFTFTLIDIWSRVLYISVTVAHAVANGSAERVVSNGCGLLPIGNNSCGPSTDMGSTGQANSSYRIFNLTVRRNWWRNFLFTFYKHRRKQMSAVILKPIIEVTSSTRYLYEKFLSYDCNDRANLRFFVRSFVNSVMHVLKNLRTQNLRTETGVRTFMNSMPGSEDQYASLCQMLCRSVKLLPRYRNF